MVKKNTMGIKDYFKDLIQLFSTGNLPDKFTQKKFNFIPDRNALKYNSYLLSQIKTTELDAPFLIVYMSAPNSDGEWDELGYYFVFHKDRIELVETDQYNHNNVYEYSDMKYPCTTKDEYFNLSLQYNIRFDLNFLHFIHNEFQSLSEMPARKYMIFYGLGEEVKYGYNN